MTRIELRVFLLRIDHRRHVFYAEDPETREDRADDEASSKPGFVGCLVKRVMSWKDRLTLLKGQSGGKPQKVWSWLQKFIGPDEPFLWGLRKARGIVLHHPANMTAEQARDSWSRYLRGRKTHHAIWLAVDLVVSGLSLVLMLVPGPNVLGYWFVYRAGCHALALIGVYRACRREVITSLESNGMLDLHLAGADRGSIVRLAERCGLRDLDVFLVRIGAGPGAGSAGPATPGGDPNDGREEGPAGGRGE
jgi:hypothetical protein